MKLNVQETASTLSGLQMERPGTVNKLCSGAKWSTSELEEIQPLKE